MIFQILFVERYSKFAVSFNYDSKPVKLMESRYNIGDKDYEDLEIQVYERFRKEKGISCVSLQ